MGLARYEVDELEEAFMALWDELSTPHYNRGLDNLTDEVKIPLKSFELILNCARIVGYYVYMLCTYTEREKRHELESRAEELTEYLKQYCARKEEKFSTPSE